MNFNDDVRYQGRYMHLPMTRFHQNGINTDSSTPEENVEGTISYNESNHKSCELESSGKDQENNRWKRRRSWSRSPLHHRMDRSRSRSRDRYGRDRSKSPVHKFSRGNRSYRSDNTKGDVSNRGRWRRDHHQNEVSNRWNGRGKRRGGPTRRMPPRSAKHRDCSNQIKEK